MMVLGTGTYLPIFYSHLISLPLQHFQIHKPVKLFLYLIRDYRYETFQLVATTINRLHICH